MCIVLQLWGHVTSTFKHIVLSDITRNQDGKEKNCKNVLSNYFLPFTATDMSKIETINDLNPRNISGATPWTKTKNTRCRLA